MFIESHAYLSTTTIECLTEEMRNIISIYNDNYGIDRDIYADLGGFLAVCDSINDKQTLGGLVEQFNLQTSIADVDRYITNDWRLKIFIIGDDYSISVIYSQTSNSHLNKPNEEMIIKTNAIPAIVSPQLFDKVQKRLKQNKDRRGANKAKQRYLLSSKVVCGECGCNFHGNSRKNGKGIVYSSYRCNKKNMTGKCGNTEISREHLEKYVLEHLRKMLLTKEVKKRVIAEVAKYRRMTNDSARQEEKRYKNELIGVQKKIENIVNVIAQGNTIDSLTDKLKELEQNKKSLEQSLANLDVKYSDITITEQQYTQAVSKLDEFMQANTYDFNVINFIDKCVDKIVVYEDYVEVTFMVTSFLMGESTRYVKIRVTATRNEVMGRHRSYKNNIYVPPTERNIDIFVE